MPSRPVGARFGRRRPERRLVTDRALDALNVFLTDVRDGLGPYLAVYLLAGRYWDAGSLGVALAASRSALGISARRWAPSPRPRAWARA